MSAGSEHSVVPQNPIAPPGANPPARDDREFLLQRIQELEQENARARETIAALEAERDAYRRAVYAFVMDQITEEDIARDAQPEEGLPLEAFIGELEAIVQKQQD